jgi:hypothetical protein
MSTSGVMAQLRAATVPLQCPFCDAHGWVTLVTRSNLKDYTFRWRCTNCDHELVCYSTRQQRDSQPPRCDACGSRSSRFVGGVDPCSLSTTLPACGVPLTNSSRKLPVCVKRTNLFDEAPTTGFTFTKGRCIARTASSRKFFRSQRINARPAISISFSAAKGGTGAEFRRAFARSRSRKVMTLAATRPDGCSAVPHSTLANLVRASVGTVADDRMRNGN